MFFLKTILLIVIFLTTLLAGSYPFFKKLSSERTYQFPVGESLAAGIFLGAALLHMLNESVQGFSSLGYHYPFAFFICGAVFLLFLYFDHVGREVYQHDGKDSKAFAILATVMLTIHSLFMGMALGLGESISVIIIVFLAILAHKWAASFALAIYLNKSRLSLASSVVAFIIFSASLPIGIVIGALANYRLGHYVLIEPVFMSLAAGTLLYLGTLHGLDKAVMIKNCCELNKFYYVVFGFLIMAFVAYWL